LWDISTTYESRQNGVTDPHVLTNQLDSYQLTARFASFVLRPTFLPILSTS
jgi:hypothetical protein